MFTSSPSIQIIECREFLKKYWDDSELGDFIEDTLEKQNSRIYGVDTAPALNALDYLDKESYSDDDWEVPQEEGDKAEENEPVGDKTADKPVDSSSAGVNDGAVAGEGFIELSDSEDEGEGEGEGEEEGEESDTEMQATTASVVSPAPAAPAVPTLSAAELAAQAKAAQLERLKAEQEERERVELERRKERFFAAQKAPRNSRAALLTSLRLKVHQTAKENYCNQRKIQSEGLELRLEISEKCRQLVELLKEREEGRMLMKREARRAKYQQLVRHIIIYVHSLIC